MKRFFLNKEANTFTHYEISSSIAVANLFSCISKNGIYTFNYNITLFAVLNNEIYRNRNVRKKKIVKMKR